MHRAKCSSFFAKMTGCDVAGGMVASMDELRVFFSVNNSEKGLQRACREIVAFAASKKMPTSCCGGNAAWRTRHASAYLGDVN